MRVGFEGCLLAMGAEPRPLPIEGGELALPLRSLADSRAIRSAALAAGAGAAVTIIGGGFIGVEVASAMASLGSSDGRRVGGPAVGWFPWRGTGGAWGVDRLRAAGVDVRLGSAVTRLDVGAAWIGDERLGHSFAVAGVGVRPRVELAERAGLGLDDGSSPTATAHQPSGHLAAGDVARVEGQRVEHWHAAREQANGRHCRCSTCRARLPPLAPLRGEGILRRIRTAARWGGERSDSDGSVLAYLDEGRVVQLRSHRLGRRPSARSHPRPGGATETDLSEALDPPLDEQA